MNILAIETSCDETAVAVVEASGNPLENEGAVFNVRSSVVLSQIALHAEYGGVFPALAKREHAKNLIPVLREALVRAGMQENVEKDTKPQTETSKPETLLEREPELSEQFLAYIPSIGKPDIDAIAVTYGPGLEPALWVGINFAKALALVWDVPVIPVNHMEGHFFSALSRQKGKNKFIISKLQFPILGLLISGGHTELVLTKEPLRYTLMGETRDDAVGEAFDKVARMLGLSYPGGPLIAAYAEKFRGAKRLFRLPRPMIDSPDFDFSFSGLKTAVLYQIKKTPALDQAAIRAFAHEFQEAVGDVLSAKTLRAAKESDAKAVAVGGGVSANEKIRNSLAAALKRDLPETKLALAPLEMTGDNALMIAIAGYLRKTFKPKSVLSSSAVEGLSAEGSVRLAENVSKSDKKREV